ncbi:hypothetical protein PFICI_07459 [Pestalotiopsis fici W106-1]|uniref:Uncharacterized protein n=1 Tax=Pestalotiopsis fici (strain W106-1 / CGMCC3.15140) TaxID=1229662 RepID=W3X1H6_PESFW|nr:uncharacterized protein PFICI_07459 [Pestalotiopsis fici W106-1]ETS79930.1 hypothetical protein PFICI_07459 [Pestalotiopsis fici W106-1]
MDKDKKNYPMDCEVQRSEEPWAEMSRMTERRKIEKKRLHWRGWFRSKLQGGRKTTTKATETNFQCPPDVDSLAAMPLDQSLAISRAPRQQDTRDDLGPPPYHGVDAHTLLYSGVYLKDILEIDRYVQQTVANTVREKIHANFWGHDAQTMMMIMDAIQEGCTSVAVTICRVDVQIEPAKVNAFVNEGCRKVAKAIIEAAYAVAPAGRGNHPAIAASYAAKIIREAADHFFRYKKSWRPYLAKMQLMSTAYSVGATLCWNHTNRKSILDHPVAFPAYQEFLESPL